MKTSSKKIRTTTDKSKGNKKAILGRLKHRNDVQANAQNRHDLRTGYQPKYVDGDRIELNDVLIQPLGGAELKQICNSRRAQRDLRKRAKKDGKVATTGLIAFGTEAQIWFEALDRATQNLAFRSIAEAICSRCNTTLTGLTVHRDESAVHAHFQMPAYDVDGDPLTKTMTWRDYGRLQDLVAETILEFEPRIERGNRKRDRIAAGADPADTINRSVKRLHDDLPLEIKSSEQELDDLHVERDEVQGELDELRASVASLFAQREKVNQRIERLKQQEILSEQKAKNLRIYEARHAKHVADHEAKIAEMRTAEAALATREDMIAKLHRQAELDASAIMADAKLLQKTLAQGVELIAEGNLWIDNNQWKAPAASPELRSRLRPLLKLLQPIYTKVATLFESLKAEHAKLTEERRVVALDRARAAAMVEELESLRSQMDVEQATKLDTIRTDLDFTI